MDDELPGADKEGAAKGATEQTEEAADGPPASVDSQAVYVEIGTSSLLQKYGAQAFPERVSCMVNDAYGYQRLSPMEVIHRLSMGDSGDAANRVLHLAWRCDGELVGCCSSTTQVPWCPHGCGHWGLLVVNVAAQGTGVAGALVAAAEARLALHGLHQCQIEYEYTCGDPASERLYGWYEGALGFSGGGPPTRTPGRSEFRRCRKRLDRATPSRKPRRGLRSPCSDSTADDLSTEPGSASLGGERNLAVVKCNPSRWRRTGGCCGCVRSLVRTLFAGAA